MDGVSGSRRMWHYYDQRAAEYDDWYLGRGLFTERQRSGWFEDLLRLVGAVASLPPARVIDLACGTGFLTRHLRGYVVAVDQSPAMLAVARSRAPGIAPVRADALSAPLRDGCADRLFAGHFYGHLDAAERQRFHAEAARLADEVVIVDSALRDEVQPEEHQERALSDGSRHQVYKRYFTPDGLAAELGDGTVLHAGRWFVAVRASTRGSASGLRHLPLS